jgi:protease IV
MSSYNPPPNPLGPPLRQPPPPRPRGSGILGVLFALSFLLNIVLVLAVCAGLFVMVVGSGGPDTALPLAEKLYAGPATASNKIAVVRIDGILIEGALHFADRQIETAAKDSDVKVVVLRINSPGGTITASDDLHRRLTELRDGNPTRGTTGKKHLIVSMGSVAASGGYYIAMPGSPIYAERTTITGSIGVYAALPNIHELASKQGVELTMIKRGEVKGSGSMFLKMSEQERNVWEDSIEHAYEQFLDVVETGRPVLKGQLLTKQATSFKNEQGQEVRYQRYLADGGIYTSDKALGLKLIDKIGSLDDAIEDAKKTAGLSGDVKVVTYREPFSFTDFLSVKAPQSSSQLDLAALSSAAMPRLWYMAPGNELAGLLSAVVR